MEGVTERKVANVTKVVWNLNDFLCYVWKSGIQINHCCRQQNSLVLTLSSVLPNGAANQSNGTIMMPVE